jgi:hypothetical protein
MYKWSEHFPYCTSVAGIDTASSAYENTCHPIVIKYNVLFSENTAILFKSSGNDSKNAQFTQFGVFNKEIRL